jgi:spore maturation protein CgeB
MNRSNNYSEQRILFVGHGGIGSNALSLYAGLQARVNHIEMIDTKFFDSPTRYSFRRVTHRLFPYFYGYVASQIVDFRVRKKLKNQIVDIVIVFKGMYVRKKTLERLNSIKVHYHPDDSTNLANRTAIFDQAESTYDLHFTSKKHNIEEIIKRTGKAVHFIWYAYDPKWHFRASSISFLNPTFDIGFIGHMRPDRFELILDIAKIYEKRFAVAGLKWDRFKELIELSVVYPPFYGESFSFFVKSAPLQLGLLNSDNRDQHTARSFEVPAAGGLLIAEDTPEHREMFGSESNALFFKTREELIQKISWVQDNPELARKIAENGHRYITENSNTWEDRAAEILRVVNESLH